MTKDEIVDFSASRRLTISGHVLDHNGNPLDGAIVSSSSIDPSSPYAVTDADGNYRLINIVEGYDYMVTAGRTSYVLNPNGVVLTKIDGDKTVNFVGSAASTTYSLRGSVRDAAGYGVRGVRLDLTGSSAGAV
ncbi:MAG: hypothetical protein DMF74_18575, partial [Acidobacteria bacterium]